MRPSFLADTLKSYLLSVRNAYSHNHLDGEYNYVAGFINGVSTSGIWDGSGAMYRLLDLAENACKIRRSELSKVAK
jgi:hypothetical protein